MQLDQTRIVIRERGYLDLLDLGLRVARGHAGPLLLAVALGALPMIGLNYWLLADSVADAVEFELPPMLFYFLFPFLVVVEMPLVTTFVTLYLGQALFVERPSRIQMLRDLASSLPQLLLFQVVLRALLVPFGIPLFLLFTIWPYLTEIILLERNPLRRTARRPGPTTFSRSFALHSSNTSELFARWLASLFFGSILIVSLWLSLGVINLLLTGEPMWGAAFYTIVLQVAVWAVIGFFAVVRFLSYLDLRIRSEGWEVELQMRAEGARLARQVV